MKIEIDGKRYQLVEIVDNARPQVGDWVEAVKDDCSARDQFRKGEKGQVIRMFRGLDPNGCFVSFQGHKDEADCFFTEIKRIDPPAPEPVKAEWAIGQRVEHPEFGRGTTIDIPGKTNSVLVEFDTPNEKLLHSGNGSGRPNHCYYFNPAYTRGENTTDLTRVDDQHPAYLVGDEVVIRGKVTSIDYDDILTDNDPYWVTTMSGEITSMNARDLSPAEAHDA